VAFDAVSPFQFKVSLLYLLKQSGIIPGSAIVNGGNIGGGTHRLKLFAVFLFGYIL